MPYVLRGGERFFDRPEIREARLLLRGAARAGQDAATRCPTPSAPCCQHGLVPRQRPPPGGAARERWESLAALVKLADDLRRRRRRTRTCDELVAELDQRADAQHAPTVQGVTLASLHSAKGLEWDAVFLVGLTDTTLPIQHATTPAQIAEERRLLYVGITRAREQLALSWALARSPGQRRGPPAEPVPRRHAPRGRARPAKPKKTQVGRARGRGRRAVRAAAGLAQGAGRGAERPAVRRVQRRHAGRHRRRPPATRGARRRSPASARRS